jgi:hypothetical protein
MADETRLVRTAGVAGEFRLPGLLNTPEGPADLVITPEGTEVTQEQWLAVAEAATVNHVIVRLDEEFPVAVAETQAPPPGAGEENKIEDTGTAVDGAETPPSSTGSTRKGR